MIEDASRTITELAEEIQRENDRRYRVGKWIHVTDRVLNALERLNLHGTKEIPGDVRQQARTAIDTLPNDVREVYVDKGNVQETLDSVFEVQERLFRLGGPPRAYDEPDDPDDDGIITPTTTPE